MRIPNNTVSASQFRTYGTGGFRLDEHEAEKGCPRQYKAKYVDGLKDDGPTPYPLLYGNLFHTVMHLIVRDGLTPDEAMQEAFDPLMPQEAWTELREDIDNYMARGNSPMDRFANLAVEQDLKALLYVDEEYGEIYYRGILDSLDVDLEVADVLHIVDYKTNRSPAKFADLQGDVQLRGYDWLIRQLWHRWLAKQPKIVTHLDIVKFNDVEIAYTDQDIEDWHSWAVAVTRKILRDEEAEPVLNPGCGHCFVRESCPAYNALPSIGEALQQEGSALKEPAARLKWRDRANEIRLLLEKAVKGIDAEFKTMTLQQGQVDAGDTVFTLTAAYENEVNLRRAKELLDEERFLRAISTSLAAIQRAVKDLPKEEQVKLLDQIVTRVPAGNKVVRVQKDAADKAKAKEAGAA